MSGKLSVFSYWLLDFNWHLFYLWKRETKRDFKIP